ncbi:MAG TPA: hypothetical protein VF265_06295 [Nevskiaceae bacterium]
MGSTIAPAAPTMGEAVGTSEADVADVVEGEEVAQPDDREVRLRQRPGRDAVQARQQLGAA